MVQRLAKCKISLSWGFSLKTNPGYLRVNPDVETTNWRAECGRTARSVWREGRAGAFSTPIN